MSSPSSPRGIKTERCDSPFSFSSPKRHRISPEAADGAPASPATDLSSITVNPPSSPAYTPSSPAYTPSSPAYRATSPAYTPSSPVYHPCDDEEAKSPNETLALTRWNISTFAMFWEPRHVLGRLVVPGDNHKFIGEPWSIKDLDYFSVDPLIAADRKELVAVLAEALGDALEESVKIEFGRAAVPDRCNLRMYTKPSEWPAGAALLEEACCGYTGKIPAYFYWRSKIAHEETVYFATHATAPLTDDACQRVYELLLSILVKCSHVSRLDSKEKEQMEDTYAQFVSVDSEK